MSDIKLKRQFISVHEFSQVTGQMPATIRKWIKEDRIKAKKIGSTWLIFKTELDNLLENKDASIDALLNSTSTKTPSKKAVKRAISNYSPEKRELLLKALRSCTKQEDLPTEDKREK